MRKLLLPSLVFSVLVAGVLPARAQDDVRAIVAKAIKAHGGEEKLAKYKAAKSKSKGIINLRGEKNFTEETTFLSPGKIKIAIQIGDNAGMVVFNGEKGWVSENGTVKNMSEDLIALLKEDLYFANVGKMIFLKEKDYELSSLGEVKVEGKPAFGVRVISKGHRDISLFFDKDTGLVVKTERRKTDPASRREVKEERVITEYQDIEGMKSPKKLIGYEDGRKFIEAELVEIKLLESVDDSEFNKP